MALPEEPVHDHRVTVAGAASSYRLRILAASGDFFILAPLTPALDATVISTAPLQQGASIDNIVAAWRRDNHRKATDRPTFDAFAWLLALRDVRGVPDALMHIDLGAFRDEIEKYHRTAPLVIDLTGE